ncbi:DUF2956 domain-containing protein [Vibrio gangliei]|uniref:DUF2956 domain-containing protein n=1 Tax=Vibrio gangliei TaxID=2077090 RepID=UPI000D0194AE|nr:DUF2956 domain-containing protein [Vibrio gangliei]
MKSSKAQISPQTQQEALAVAKSIQKPGQTKEQTKLIAQGIEKGIALYKKQHKEKLREADKLRKQQTKPSLSEPTDDIQNSVTSHDRSKGSILPWSLLVLSWLGFAIYLLLQR